MAHEQPSTHSEVPAYFGVDPPSLLKYINDGAFAALLTATFIGTVILNKLLPEARAVVETLTRLQGLVENSYNRLSAQLEELRRDITDRK